MDVAEERSVPPKENDNQGPQGPQGPWFGRLRRQRPPTSGYNGREGHCDTVGQAELIFRPGINNLEPCQERKWPARDLKGLHQETEGPGVQDSKCRKDRGRSTLEDTGKK